jgi:Amt family ammonium transporter
MPLEYFRIDDPVGAVPVHGLNGIWGTLSIGFFACGKYGFTGPTGPDDSHPITGLFYGGGTDQLVKQLIGSASITFGTFAIAGIMMFVLGKLPYPWKLRVEEHGELMKGGIDVFEHGTSAYPEQDEEVSLSGLFEPGVKAPLA